MVNWADPNVQVICALAFNQVITFDLGMYLWYFTLTLRNVEFRLLLFKSRLGFAHIPYFLARYSELLSLILNFALTRDTFPIVECSQIAFMRGVSVLGNTALTSASANIALRAIMIWRDKPVIVFIVALTSLSQFVYGLSMGITGIEKSYSVEQGSCLVIHTLAKAQIIALFMLTLVLDLTILCLTVSGLRRQGLTNTSYPLVNALYKQGGLYALVSFLTTIPSVVVLMLELNISMNVMVSIPARTISVIASSESVVSLLNLRDQTDYTIPVGSSYDRDHNERDEGVLTSYLEEPISSISYSV